MCDADARALTFTVEGPPVAYTRMTRGTKFSARAQRYFAYREQIGYRAKEAGACILSDRVSVEIVAHCYRRRFDIDNLAKSVLDALTGICYEDDKQVTVLAAMIYDKGPSSVGIDVRVMPLT